MTVRTPPDLSHGPASHAGLVLEHPASLDLLERLTRIARSDAPVLILGESGTGKEVFAREVHARSGRAERPFVAVNAGTFSEQLIDSELFGHEKGAFTGAHERKLGWFEAADGGSLFLDEIGDLPQPLQVKLLRVLSTGEVTRIGSRAPTSVDVRLIAATNVDLLAAMRARRFREDLYYRLSVTTLSLPPLRERPGDVLPLARHFLLRYAGKLARPKLQLSDEAEAALLRHDWPGNVRELENVMHQCAILCGGDVVLASDVATLLPSRAIAVVPASSSLSPGTVPTPQSLRNVLPSGEPAAWAALERAVADLLEHAPAELYSRVEATLLTAAFDHAQRNQLETARMLGLSRHVVRARLIAHGNLPGPVRRVGSTWVVDPEPAPRVVPGKTRREERVLRIGYQTLGLLGLVRAYGAFDAALRQRKLEIAWREYAGGIQIVEALRQGDLDVGVVGDFPAVYAQAEGVPVVYVAAEPPAERGAALIVPHDSRVRSVRELRGKRVAVNRAAQAHFLLMLALEEAGLTHQDIELCFEPPARALAEFQNGGIDAWAIWDPWLSSARLDLGARVLRDTTGLFDSSVYYLAHQNFAAAHPELVRELRLQLALAARWVESDPSRVAQFVAPSLGLSARALAASLDRALLSDGISPGQIATQQRIADQCVRLQLIPRPVTVAEAQWPLATSTTA